MYFVHLRKATEDERLPLSLNYGAAEQLLRSTVI